MSEDEGPQPGYAGRHYCQPLVHHCWETCGYRLHHGHGTAEDLDYIRWEDRPGPVAHRSFADERTYADFSADGRVIGVGFQQAHGPDDCRHPENVRGHAGIETPAKPFYGPLSEEEEHDEEACDCDPPAGLIAVQMLPEDGGLVSRGWVLDSREQVEALVAELTERFGEPHHEGTLDQIGFAHVMGAVQVNAVIT